MHRGGRAQVCSRTSAHIRVHPRATRSQRTLLYKICILYIIYRIKLSKYAKTLHKYV